MAKFDVLVAGELNPDIILRDPDMKVKFGQVEYMVKEADLTIGSSSAIFACGAARLGLRVAFIGIVGEDLFGRFMLDSLSSAGVDVSNCITDPDLDTGLSVILSRRGDRAILTHSGAINALRADLIPDQLLQQTSHLHIASYFLQTALQPDLADLFQRAHTLHKTTSLDVNWDPAGHWEDVKKILPHTDVFFPNENEGLALTAASDPEEAIQSLAKDIPIVAFKLGAEGGLARGGSKTVRVSPPRLDVVDTVGAGDSFDAGFVYGYLKGWPVLRSLQLAVACGSLSVLASGGTKGQPDLDRALRFIREQLEFD